MTTTDITTVTEEQVTAPLTGLAGLNELISGIWNGFVGMIPTILFAILILIVGIIISKVTVKIMDKALDRSKLDLTINRFLKSVVKIVLYVLLITVVLTILGVPMTSIITVIGTAGVAIGLALQDSLSNLAGGFLILFAKPFKVGSYIESNGVGGTVESINILYTRLVTGDNKVIYIPNGMAANAVCINYNEEKYRRVDNVIAISYDESYERAETAIRKALASVDKIVETKDMETTVRLCAHGKSSIDIAVRVWTKTDDYWDVNFAILKAIKDEFDKEHIAIPYEQLDVHINKA